jgi:hypothetical protein
MWTAGAPKSDLEYSALGLAHVWGAAPDPSGWNPNMICKNSHDMQNLIRVADAITTTIFRALDWFYLTLILFFLGLAVWLALGPHGSRCSSSSGRRPWQCIAPSPEAWESLAARSHPALCGAYRLLGRTRGHGSTAGMGEVAIGICLLKHGYLRKSRRLSTIVRGDADRGREPTSVLILIGHFCHS